MGKINENILASCTLQHIVLILYVVPFNECIVCLQSAVLYAFERILFIQNVYAAD